MKGYKFYKDLAYINTSSKKYPVGKVNYWINDKPKINNYNFKTYKFNRISNGYNTPLNKEIGIVLELFLTRNASNYALLGLEYEYLNQNLFSIDILYNEENNFNYKSDLLTEYFNEYVYCGLNKEYLSCVVKSINDFIDYNNLDIRGKLKINIGANSELGSSNSIFYFITQVLLSILNDLLDINLISAELVKSIIEKNLRQQYMKLRENVLENYILD